MEQRVCIPVPVLKLSFSNGWLTVYKTERELGIAIKESGVAREKLFVTTKVNNENINDIAGAIKASLEKLQLDYVDL